MNAWDDFDCGDALNELKKKVSAIGLKVVVKSDTLAYPDAEIYDEKEFLTWVHYDPGEGWASEDHARLFTRLEDIIAHLKAQRGRKKSKPRQLVITIDYGKGEVPELPDWTSEAIKKLLPGKPQSVTVK